MTEFDERLSALMDDEVPSTERDGLLDRLGRDDEGRDRWRRWHLIGDVMRGDGVAIDLTRSLSARLDAEPPLAGAPRPGVYLSGRRGRRHRWLPLLGGGALAASVAGLLWVASPLWQPPVAEVPIQLVAAPVIHPAAKPAVPQGQTQWRYLKPRADARMNEYLAGHGEYASPAGVSGVLPYAAFVSYTSGR